MNLKKVIPLLLLAITYCLPTYAQYGHGFGGYRAINGNNHYNYYNYIQTYNRKKENGDNVDNFYRVQEGLVFGLINATYKLDYIFSDGTGANGIKNYYSGEKEFKIKGMAYGLSNERYFSLGKTSENSLIAFTVGVDMLYIKFKFEETRLSRGYTFTPEHNILQGNVPLGLAYKTGTDAVLRSNVKSGFSFGGGALFNTNFDLGPNGGFPTINIRPYATIEMAFYTSFCWKIRGTAHLGKVPLSISSEYTGISVSDEETTMTITAKPSFFLSFIFTDFSWDWDEE
ncbi:MAG: hypothetical protein V4561_12900 [Bacteroidota bacterium]